MEGPFGLPCTSASPLLAWNASLWAEGPGEWGWGVGGTRLRTCLGIRMQNPWLDSRLVPPLRCLQGNRRRSDSVPRQGHNSSTSGNAAPSPEAGSLWLSLWVPVLKGGRKAGLQSPLLSQPASQDWAGLPLHKPLAPFLPGESASSRKSFCLRGWPQHGASGPLCLSEGWRHLYPSSRCTARQPWGGIGGCVCPFLSWALWDAVAGSRAWSFVWDYWLLCSLVRILPPVAERGL